MDTSYREGFLFGAIVLKKKPSVILTGLMILMLIGITNCEKGNTNNSNPGIFMK